MTTNELTCELRANNIKDGVCLILPALPVEGALSLVRTDDGGWRVILNERGEYLVYETFLSEHDACRFFLKRHCLNRHTARTSRLLFSPLGLREKGKYWRNMDLTKTKADKCSGRCCIQNKLGFKVNCSIWVIGGVGLIAV
jgi:hypothetical protein